MMAQQIAEIQLKYYYLFQILKDSFLQNDITGNGLKVAFFWLYESYFERAILKCHFIALKA